MWPKVVIGLVAFKVMFSLINASDASDTNIPSLPFCGNKNGSGTILVSTLDGKLSALNSSGDLTWQIETQPGPLLTSNIHKLELTNNGEWIRIIPSLTGTLYKFDGNTIDPIAISAESLLRASFKYSDDLVIAGGLEVRSYGVGFRTGKLLYECSQAKCSHHGKEEMDDVLVVERNTQTVRAVELRTGHERWNFSVGILNIKLPQVSCIDTNIFEPNIKAVLPDGILSVSFDKNIKTNWQYKFKTPIVKIWVWNGLELKEENLFEPTNMPEVINPTPIYPSIYIGMHKKQLYIYESPEMQDALQGYLNTDLATTESSSITKIPWKPIPASSEISEDDSTALSVLNNSEYVNGNGYYLYSEHNIQEKDNQLCETHRNNQISNINVEEQIIYSGIFSYLNNCIRYYKELLLMVFTVMIVGSYKVWSKILPRPEEIITGEIVEPPVETPLEAPVEVPVTRAERQFSEKSESFTSRFEEDYDTIQCLGKGGFGVVFEAKQKYDECHYAIKRITLPNEKASRAKVMREVKALAKLEHPNIVRYFNCWIECPPLGWEKEHDKNWVEEMSISSNFTSTGTTSKALHIKRIKSHSISIPLCHIEEPSFDDYESGDSHNLDDDDDDSFVVFESDGDEEKEDKMKNVSNKTVAIKENSDSFAVSFQENSTQKAIPNDTTSELSTSEHLQKKINWKRPGRKHHSWDISESDLIPSITADPPAYLYIQMQLCQKDCLKEWLQNNSRRTYPIMLAIFLEIVEAVEYVHLRKLIHRDLKPGNIFFSFDGHIKVGDFGLAKDIEGAIDKEFLKRGHTMSYKGHTREVGTQLYMSPEQYKGQIYDYKVDIYSLGIILVELLVPFSTNMERIKTLTNLKNGKYPCGFSEKYPEVYSLLKHMLNENPAERLTTKGIKARPPFSESILNTDEHFNLIHFQAK